MVIGAQAACRSGHCRTNAELNVMSGAAVYRKKDENVAGLLIERKLASSELYFSFGVFFFYR